MTSREAEARNSRILGATPPLIVAGRSLRPTAAFGSYWALAAERQAIFFRRLNGQRPPWMTIPRQVRTSGVHELGGACVAPSPLPHGMPHMAVHPPSGAGGKPPGSHTALVLAPVARSDSACTRPTLRAPQDRDRPVRSAEGLFAFPISSVSGGRRRAISAPLGVQWTPLGPVQRTPTPGAPLAYPLRAPMTVASKIASTSTRLSVRSVMSGPPFWLVVGGLSADKGQCSGGVGHSFQVFWPFLGKILRAPVGDCGAARN